MPHKNEPITVSIELDVPKDRVFPEELDLIEQHFATLLAQYYARATDGGQAHGSGAVRKGLDDPTSR